ncbi:MAG TPA: ATP-binding cassette domain-containing protein [Burkholderiales bacterium]
MSGTVLAEVSHVSRYYGGLLAVNDVSFTVRQGEILGFLGPNGAGKTTTMQILTGNLAPSAGAVRIAGHDLLAEPKAAKAALGYLPEQPPVYRDLTVDEYLDYCAALNRIPRPKRRAARESAKEKCGLTDVGRRLIGNLSKGYQQRVGIAQAIIHMPPLVILDEPTVGLDPIQIREIRELIRELGKNHAVILSTHILPEVQATCDRVQIIHKGNLVLADTIDGLARHLRSAAVIVGLHRPPPTAELMAVPGILEVDNLGDGRWRLRHEPGVDPVEQIARLALERDWGLREIGPERASLEQIFVELTTSEQQPVEAEAAA